jgi:hypothetical protein
MIHSLGVFDRVSLESNCAPISVICQSTERMTFHQVPLFVITARAERGVLFNPKGVVPARINRALCSRAEPHMGRGLPSSGQKRVLVRYGRIGRASRRAVEGPSMSARNTAQLVADETLMPCSLNRISTPNRITFGQLAASRCSRWGRR